ncbi:hypothetical protein [uncultured Stenotrophomonas sp.]|uniref:hypothetical protein n=1 Tax=uncultured Stenotrophomonas sp. TaxID=165438 RepID=UPI0028D2BA44|nr:hypothetical protein [uncultured Stenotrophomonas sp.]
MKMHGINSSTFAIGLCALAVFAATADKKFLPVACIAGIVLVVARVADSWQKRSRNGSADTD